MILVPRTAFCNRDAKCFGLGDVKQERAYQGILSRIGELKRRRLAAFVMQIRRILTVPLSPPIWYRHLVERRDLLLEVSGTGIRGVNIATRRHLVDTRFE